MTDKKWNDDLRQRLSEYTENPPEGLWEALEAAGADGAGKGVEAGAAGAASGGGLFGRLFGRRMAPVWWSLAGVAAALAAVLIHRVPGGSVKVNPADAIIVDSPGAVAQTDIPEVAQAQESGVEAQEPSGTAPSTVTAPVISTEAERSGEIFTPSNVSADASSSVASPDASSVISTEAERSGEISSSPSEQNQSAPFESNQSDFDPESVSHTVKRDRPLIAATILGAGMPGSTSVTNTMNYGLRTGNLKMAATPREATMLSRNRITETSITHRLDFQLGLMVSFDITRHWGLETGLLYTRLASTATSICGKITSTSEDRLNYLGIPLHVIYTPVQLRLMSIYFSAGPELEYGIGRNWRVYDMIDSGITASDHGTDFLGDFILSASLNAGIQIHPTRHGAFFLQPGVVFRHVWDTTLESYYTDHPISFRLSAGYRITF